MHIPTKYSRCNFEERSLPLWFKNGCPFCFQAIRRNIALAGFAVEALKQHRIRQKEMKRLAGDIWEEHDYVFCTPLGKHLNPGHGVLVQLKILLEKAGLPDIRFHDLRHSAATLLLSMGVHPKVVQEILGHSEISMTMDIYSHVLPTMQKDAMVKLNQAFSEEGPSNL
jgi:integrase